MGELSPPPSPEQVRRRRRGLALATVAAALVFGLALHDAARQSGWRVDLSLGRLDAPKAPTREAIGGLETDVQALLFFDRRDPVYARLRPWLDALAHESERFSVRRVDRAARPQLARLHQVERDGTLVLAPPGAEGARLVVGTTLAGARSTLRRIDAELLETLVAATEPPRRAYLVQGHGEPTLARAPGRLVELLRRSRIVPHAWDLARPLDPAGEDLVILLAPRAPLEPSEEDALARFVAGGGRLLVALEPEGATPARLLRALGVSARPGVVRSAEGEARLRARPSAAHPISASVEAPVHVDGALAFERVGNRRVVAPLRVERAFVDADADGARSAGERLTNLAVVLATRFTRRGRDGHEGRAVVVGDADLLANDALARPGPEALARGALGWLEERDGSRAGPVVATAAAELEIDHAGGDARVVYRGWAFGVPAGLFAIAFWRRRRS